MGAFTTASIDGVIFAAGFSPWLVFPLMAVAAIGVGVLVGGPLEKYLLSHIYELEDVLQILVTYSVFMILEDVQRLVWGVQPRFEATALNALGTITVFGITYTAYQLLLLPSVRSRAIARQGGRTSLEGAG